MALEYQGDNFAQSVTEALKKSSQTINLPDLKHNEILKIVAAATGLPETVSYEQGVEMVEKMTRTVPRRNWKVVTGAGVAVLAAALLLVVSVGPAFNPADPTTQIADAGVPLAAGVESGYTVDVVEFDKVADPSMELPAFSGFETDDNYIYLYFEFDSGSDAWQAIYAVDSTGNRIEPVLVDAEQGLVQFELPSEQIQVYFDDNEGTVAKTTIFKDN